MSSLAKGIPRECGGDDKASEKHKQDFCVIDDANLSCKHFLACHPREAFRVRRLTVCDTTVRGWEPAVPCHFWEMLCRRLDRPDCLGDVVSLHDANARKRTEYSLPGLPGQILLVRTGLATRTPRSRKGKN